MFSDSDASAAVDAADEIIRTHARGLDAAPAAATGPRPHAPVRAGRSRDRAVAAIAAADALVRDYARGELVVFRSQQGILRHEQRRRGQDGRVWGTGWVVDPSIEAVRHAMAEQQQALARQGYRVFNLLWDEDCDGWMSVFGSLVARCKFEFEEAA